MTPRWGKLILGLTTAGAAVAGTAMAHSKLQQDPLAPLPPGTARPTLPPVITPRAIPGAPAELRERIASLGRAFNGKAGISVISIKDGWQAEYNGAILYPQQSCSKLWVAITALDAVDR